jgi:hypothetical protein
MKKNKKKPATYRCALCDTCSKLIKEGAWRVYQNVLTWVCEDCAAYLPAPPRGKKKDKTGPGAYGKTCFHCCDILDRRVRNQRIKTLLGELYHESTEHQDEILALLEELDDDCL